MPDTIETAFAPFLATLPLIFPRRGRGTVRAADGGGVGAAGGSLAATPLHQPAAGPPPLAGEDERGLRLSEHTNLGIASIMVRAGQGEALIARIAEAYGIEAIDGPSRVAVNGRAMIGVGPGAWLFSKQDAPLDWAGDVAEALADHASVFDQSSGYAVLRVEGTDAAALIGKGAFLDLHPSAFPPGSAAVTVIEHIGAIVWRIDAACFEIAVFRSFAGSFWHWLITAAAAMGAIPQRAEIASSLSPGDGHAR